MSPFYVIIPFIMSLLILLVLAGYAYLHRDDISGRSFLAFNLTAIIWVGGFIL